MMDIGNSILYSWNQNYMCKQIYTKQSTIHNTNVQYGRGLMK